MGAALAFAQSAPFHGSGLPASFRSAAQSRPRSTTSQKNILSAAGLIATAAGFYHRSRTLRQAVLSRNPDGLFRFITAPLEKAQPVAMNRSTANEPFKVSNQVGVLEPLGIPGVSYWDPAGLASDDPKQFRQFRTAELKHGRVAMLANLGLIVQALTKFEVVGNDGNGALPRGARAVFEYSTPGAWLGIIVLLCGFFELRLADDSNREPGNFGDPGELAEWAGMEQGPGTPGNRLGYNTMTRNYELNNGRLAMLGFIGSITAEYVTGLDCKGQWAAGNAAILDTLKRTLPYSP